MLYLVELPDNKRIVTASVPQKHNKNMPGLLVPFSSGTLHQTNHQQIQQHFVLSPAPAPPPPPPLDFISNIKVEMKPVISSLVSHPPPPIVADRPIKLEFAPPPPPPLYEATPTKPISTVRPTQTTTKAKPATISQVMTDVFEILIKNGELPETAVFDPTTANTSILPNSMNQQSLHQPQNAMLFSSLTNSNQADMKPITDSSADDGSKYLLDPHRPDLDNIEMLSPMQPDCDNSVSSFNIFFDRHEQKHNDEQQEIQQNQQHQTQQQQQQQEHKNKANEIQERQLQQLDDLNRATHLQQSNHHAPSSPLMALKSNQLNMDMNDDPYHQFSINYHLPLLHNDNNICSDDVGSSKINRRDPSLQPSLNELIQQQQLQQSQQQNFSNGFRICHNNNVNHTNANNRNHSTNTLNNNDSNYNHNHLDHLTYTSTPMDIEDFDSSLSSYDFSQITGVPNDHQQINTPPHHPFGQSNMQSNVEQLSHHQQNQSTMISNQQPSGSHMNNHSNQQQLYYAYGSPLASNSENFLDLFNIDDFKMSNDNSLPWSDVDFTA